MASIFRPKYKDRHGIRRESAVWWIQYHVKGCVIRESAKTKSRQLALRLARMRQGDAVSDDLAFVRVRGVRVREKPPHSGVWWLFANWHGMRTSAKIGTHEAAVMAADDLRRKLCAGKVSGVTLEQVHPNLPTPINSPNIKDSSEPDALTNNEMIMEKAEERFRKWPGMESPGFVYILQSGQNLYKIGMTTDIRKRISALLNMNPEPLRLIHCFVVEDPGEFECELHQHLSHARKHGEWFRLSSRDLENISLRYGLGWVA